MTNLKEMGIKSIGTAANVTLSKKSSPGDGLFGKGIRGCGPSELPPCI